jgi:hypothetical protein
VTNGYTGWLDGPVCDHIGRCRHGQMECGHLTLVYRRIDASNWSRVIPLDSGKWSAKTGLSLALTHDPDSFLCLTVYYPATHSPGPIVII